MRKNCSVFLVVLTFFLTMIGCQSSTSPANPVPPPPLKSESPEIKPAAGKSANNIAFIEKINAIPDYTQTDPEYGGFPGKGSEHCGPTSASNALMWLSDNGFPNLAPHTSDRKKDQFDVIYLLGSAQYMNTGITGSALGTNPTKFCRGLKQYILDKGYKFSRLEFQGWRDIPPEFDTRVSIPELEWIKQGIRGLGSVFLSAGWFTYDSSTDEYKRFNAHWVTLVGYGHDGKADNPNALIIHNSLTRSTDSTRNEYIYPERINSGKLTGAFTGLPRSAAGYYKIKGIGMPKNADAAILDYAIVLEMQP